MSLARRVLALALVFSLFPGASEVVENAGHLARHGHLAHGLTADYTHGEPGPEHGCTATFHVCSCHPTVAFLMPTERELLPPGRGLALYGPGVSFAARADLSSVFHPPRA